MAVIAGLRDVLAALLQAGARLDAQDRDGQTAIHLAVRSGEESMLALMLNDGDPSALMIRDRKGASALALAMQTRNHRIAQLIVTRAPHTALQTNGSVGENLLHVAVRAGDLESVLFLLGMHVDVNVCTTDARRITPLHLCAQGDHEMIMRNLLLAGSEVNAQSGDEGLTPLHVACANDRAALVAILLQNGANVEMRDCNGNNALHSAVAQGSLESVRVLLAESSINCRAQNRRGQSPVMLCATNDGLNSVEIFDALMQRDPDYPLELLDVDGNTVFLLAFIRGNAELCRAVLRRGACFAVTNHFGISVFNHETPTKQLLFGLLDGLDREPKWADNDCCSQCDAKFTLTMRKHHCRHCGRLVCARCSERTIPILKYDLVKAVRVCALCFDLLSTGIR